MLNSVIKENQISLWKFFIFLQILFQDYN